MKTKTEKIALRIDQKEKTALQILAAKIGVSPSEFIRRLIKHEILTQDSV